MAMTTVDSNNKLIEFTRQINREFIRENMFSPYMGEDLNAIIRIRSELKNGGEQMNIPLVTRLNGTGKGVGTLVGNEEKIDNYGMRVWLDWSRHAVTMNKAERHKDAGLAFGVAKPLLTDWGKELQRDELIEALMALPSESAPANLGSDEGQRVNGLLFENTTVGQRNAWMADNEDRILFGAAVSNFSSGVYATALATLDSTNDKLTYTNLSLAKRRAMNANPRIRPFKTKDGYEHFVAFAGTRAFRDLKLSLATINQDGRPREGDAINRNPLFQDGDLLYDGVIVRQVPEITTLVEDKWSAAALLGTTAEPVFFCGQQTAVMAWGQMFMPTERKEDDYGFIKGVGIEGAYGVSKMFKKDANADLKQWGMLSMFVYAAADA
jgi:hypothetical protein